MHQMTLCYNALSQIRPRYAPQRGARYTTCDRRLEIAQGPWSCVRSCVTVISLTGCVCASESHKSRRRRVAAVYSSVRFWGRCHPPPVLLGVRQVLFLVVHFGTGLEPQGVPQGGPDGRIAARCQPVRRWRPSSLCAFT